MILTTEAAIADSPDEAGGPTPPANMGGMGF
jgi:hypothetical protein